jgi:hypothetical protein
MFCLYSNAYFSPRYTRGHTVFEKKRRPTSKVNGRENYFNDGKFRI